MADDDDRRSTLEVLRGSRVLAFSVGAVTLVAGLILLFWPDRTVTVVARLSGVLLVIVGIGDLVDTVKNHRKGSYWGILLLRGIVHLGFGLALVLWGGITLSVLVWLFGLDMVITGVIGLVVVRGMPSEFRGGTIARSVVTILFGIALMVWPSSTLTVVAMLVGALLSLLGLVLLWSGYQLTRMSKQVEAA